MKKVLLSLLLIVFLLYLFSCTEESEVICHLSFLSNGGTIETTSMDVAFGTTITLPTPVKENKTFTGWIGNGGLVLNPNAYLVTSNEEFIARYDSYDVTYLGLDGEVVAKKSFNEGETYICNDTILANIVTDTTYYQFTGWDETHIVDKIEQDYTVNSKWTTESYTHTVFSLEPWLNEDSDDYDFDLYLKDSMFSDGIKEDYETIFFAMCSAFTNYGKVSMTNFFTDLGFDNIYLSNDYYVASTADTHSFAFAHKELSNGTHFINVSIQGVYSDIEWINNFEIGATGIASGYLKNATRMQEALYEYLEIYETDKVLIIIDGYSRGGGVAQVLSYLLNHDEDCPISSNQHKTFTFEAPRPIDSEVEVTNCHNYYMDGDIVASVSPAQFGLYHYGINHPVSVAIEDYVKILDSGISVPKFVSNPGLYETQPEYLDYIWGIVTSTDYPESVGLLNRELFATYWQPTICYFLEIYAKASYSTISKIENVFTSKSLEELKRIIQDGAKLKEALYPILDSDYRLTIDEDELTSCLNQVAVLMKDGPGTRLVTSFFLNSANIKRCIIYHYPELIISYISYMYNSQNPVVKK